MRTLTVRIEGDDSFLVRAREAARKVDASGGYQGEEYSFADLPQLLATFTPNRWKLIQKLQEVGPSSLRGLARALGRDVKRVHEDAAVLIEKGIIERDAQNKLLVPYANIHIDVQLKTPSAAA